MSTRRLAGADEAASRAPSPGDTVADARDFRFDLNRGYLARLAQKLT